MSHIEKRFSHLGLHNSMQYAPRKRGLETLKDIMINTISDIKYVKVALPHSALLPHSAMPLRA